jgi:hypothetical protein
MSQHQFPASEIISMDGISVLKIENTNNAHFEMSILKITDLPLIKRMSAIEFDLKYENVSGRNFFGDAGARFGRIIYDQNLYSQPGNIEENDFGEVGGFGLSWEIPPNAREGDTITNHSRIMFAGKSNWKRCHLYSPMALPLKSLPTQMELSFYLPGPGTVYLRPIKLLAQPSDWWSPQPIALVEGIGGSVIGCFGGLIGCLAGMGKARRFVLATTKLFIAFGILLTIAGIVAIALKQPYSVWYALLLPGGILTFVFSVNLYPIKRRYDDLEIRRMTSMDATGL